MCCVTVKCIRYIIRVSGDFLKLPATYLQKYWILMYEICEMYEFKNTSSQFYFCKCFAANQ